MTKRWLPLLVILSVFLVLLITAAMFMQYRVPCGYGGMMGPWMMGGLGIGGVLLGVLVLVFVIGGSVWLVQSLARGSSGSSLPASETPLEIIKRRYASGEITKEQFEAMRRDLGL